MNKDELKDSMIKNIIEIEKEYLSISSDVNSRRFDAVNKIYMLIKDAEIKDED